MSGRSAQAPVFILAPPRSYTSVACAMLGQHPALYGLPEINLFIADRVGDLLEIFQSRPGLKHGILRAVAQLGTGEQSNDGVDAAAEWLAIHAEAGTDEIFGDLAAWATPRRLVDKSPLYCLREGALERIASRLPQARYLHLTRHPSATMDSLGRFRSLVRKRVSGGRFPADAPGPGDLKRFWLEPHRSILTFLDGVPEHRRLRIQGEQLLADPDAVLRDIAAWLGVATDETAIAAMKRPQQSPFACEGPPRARYGNDPEFLSSPTLRPVTVREKTNDLALPAEARECAGLLGYDATSYPRPDPIPRSAPTAL